MAITFGYATLAEFKAYRAVRGVTTGTDATDDTVMEDIVELSSRFIDGQTGRRFFKNSTDETRYFTAKEDNYIEVDDLSAAPTTVSVDYLNSRSYTDLSATDFELDPLNASLDGMPFTGMYILPTSATYFPVNVRNGVKVAAKFGFPSVPDDIKELTLALSQNIYQSRSGQSSAGNVSVTASGIVIRPQDMPDFGQLIIRKYRKYR
jgi:hypothetical protein